MRVLFLNSHHLLFFFIRNPWIYTDDMYSFSHSYMHVTLFEIEKASRQCSIQTSLAVSPLSSDEMASSNPAKETGLTVRGRCTTNKNTELFKKKKKKVKLWRHHQLLLILPSFSLFGCSHSDGDLILVFRQWSNQSDHLQNNSESSALTTSARMSERQNCDSHSYWNT